MTSAYRELKTDDCNAKVTEHFSVHVLKDISSSKGFIFFKTNEKITKVMKNFQKMKIQLHPFVSFYELCDFTILTLSFQKSIRKLVFSFDTRIKKLKKNKLRLNFKDIFK